MRAARYFLFICGAGLFIALLVRIGPGTVVAAFSELSWRLPVIVLFPFCIMTVFDTLGWRFAFRYNRVPLRSLLAARMAGEAFNATTPTASLGGEVVKAWLVRPYAPLTESLPSVIIAKTTITVGQTLFLLVGVVTAWWTLPGDSSLLLGMQWLLILEIIGAGGFVTVQVLGVMGGAGRLVQRLARFGPHGPADVLGQVDRGLSHFYRNEPLRLALSTAFHFVGWALGVLESYIILHALGLEASLPTAVVIDAFGTGVGFAAFLVPARLGALEAGQVAVFTALGFGAPAGLAFGLVQRLREAVWTGIGLLALTSLRAAVPARAIRAPRLCRSCRPLGRDIA